MEDKISIGAEGSLRTRHYIIPSNEVKATPNEHHVNTYNLPVPDPFHPTIFRCQNGRLILYDERLKTFYSTKFNENSFKALHFDGWNVENFDFTAFSGDMNLAIGFSKPLPRKKSRKSPQSGSLMNMTIFDFEKRSTTETSLSLGIETIDCFFSATISPNNKLLSVLYRTTKSSKHIICKIFQFTKSGGFKQHRTFRIQSLGYERVKYVCSSSFNEHENLLMVNINRIPRHVDTESISVYDIDKKKLNYVSYESQGFLVESFLVSTNQGPFVFVLDLRDTRITGYKLDLVTGAHSKVSSMKLITGNFIDEPFDVEMKVYFNTTIRIFLSSNEKLYILCPFEDKIIKKFPLLLEEKDPFIEHRKIAINCSGEEIFVFCQLMHGAFKHRYKLTMFHYNEDDSPKNSLLQLAKRSVLSNFNKSQLENFNLPRSLKEMLGVL